MLKNLVICLLILTFIFTSTGFVYPQQAYRIKKGDILEIKVWGHDDLTTDVTVDDEGKVSYPLLGEVVAEGLTASGLDENITYLLKKDYIREPNVTIKIKERTFFIYGEVKKPGSYKIAGTVGILKAISLARGFTDYATKKVKIMRRVGEEETIIDVDVNKVLKDKKKQNKVFVQPDDVVVCY